MGEVIVYSVYILFAFGLAMAIVFGLAGTLHVGTRIRSEPLPWAFFCIVLAIMAVPIATGRVLSAGLSYREASVEDIGSSFWVSRALTIVVLVLCVERIGRFFLRRRQVFQAWPLWWTFFAFALAGQVLNSALGAHRSFDQKGLYAFFLFFAFFVVAQQQPERCLRFARAALLLFLVGSAVAIPVRPTAVLEFAYVGGIPGLNFRYYGLATHANTMGPMAIAFMILLWHMPFRSRLFNLAAWALASGSLVLSQSKTSIAIAAGIGLFLVAYKYRASLIDRSPGNAIRFALAAWVMVCLGLAALVLGLAFGINYIDWAMGKLDTVTAGQLSTLSGRTRIWALAWSEFLSSPVFGYGPTIWDPEYRYFAQMPFAAHAHNQLLQSLSSAGAVGGLTFIVFAIVLAVYAARASVATGGASVALVALMLIRCVSEVPFATGSVMQAEFIIMLLALCMCVGRFARPVAIETPVPTDASGRLPPSRMSAAGA